MLIFYASSCGRHELSSLTLTLPAAGPSCTSACAQSSLNVGLKDVSCTRGCMDTHLSAKMEGHDRIILGVQDEQRAGDVLHTVGGEKGLDQDLRKMAGVSWHPGPTFGRDLGLGSISSWCLTALILLGFFLLKN